MESIFERMKKLIIFNLDTISKLVDDAEQMRKEVDTSEDEKLKESLLNQIDQMERSIQQLIKHTVDLFDTYKLLVRGS
jgi:predicted phage-related endonuclease